MIVPQSSSSISGAETKRGNYACEPAAALQQARFQRNGNVNWQILVARIASISTTPYDKQLPNGVYFQHVAS